MAIKTQGTDLYVLDPEGCVVILVGCPTSIDGIDTTLEQIETTCLGASTRTYEAGLATPGTATFTINFDTDDESHARLFELKQAGTVLQWAVGLSQSPGTAPTSQTNSAGDCEFITNPARGWILFEGFMNSFPFSIPLNSVVTSTVGIQVSGEIEVVPSGP
jgi:tail tube protein